MLGWRDGSAVRTLTACFSGNLSSVPCTHTGQLTTAYNFSSGRSMELCWPVQEIPSCEHTDIQTHINIFLKMSKSFEVQTGNMGKVWVNASQCSFSSDSPFLPWRVGITIQDYTCVIKKATQFPRTWSSESWGWSSWEMILKEIYLLAKVDEVKHCQSSVLGLLKGSIQPISTGS